MMNKSKSAKRQLARFLFLVPVLAIILLSFRQSLRQSSVNPIPQTVIADTVPELTVPNSKGYFIDIQDDNGNCMVVVKDKNKKEVKRVLLTDWTAKDDYYGNLYGDLILSIKFNAVAPYLEQLSVIKEKIKAKSHDIESVTVKGNIATVTLKDGKTETYTLSINDQKKAFEERCGLTEVAIEAAEIAEPVGVTAETPITTVTEVKPVIADEFEINDNKAIMKLRNGKVEEYNLADPKELKVFEQRFGKVIRPGVRKGVYSVVSGTEVTAPSALTTVTILPSKEVKVINEEVGLTTTDEAMAITIEPEILLTITNKTTKAELDAMKTSLKTKGFELTIDESEYENGVLVKVAGTLKSKDGQANFVAVEFNKLIISHVKSGEKTYFRIDEVVKKKGVS